MKKTVAPFLITALCTSAYAAEGMWPMNQLPNAQLEALGAKPDAAWVARLQGAAVNVGGASGSFVSAQGLVLTNHHVVRGCIDRLSSQQEDLSAKGFVAQQRAAERACPGMVIRVLHGIEDVSSRVPQDSSARSSALLALEKECPEGQLCEVVALHGGALHHRYRYQRFTDVRLVMAPETQAASLGGDDDNFGYPRFSFDFALLRVYGADGKPHTPQHWLRPASSPLKAGDGVFVPGHPGRTERLLTVAQLQMLRDTQLPLDIRDAEHEQALLKRFAASSAEAARQIAAPLAGVENRLKANRGQLATLQDAAMMQAKAATEAQLRKHQGDDTPWTRIAEATKQRERMALELAAHTLQRGTLLWHALELAGLQDELARPEAERLEAYRGARALQLAESIRSAQPVYPQLEEARLTGTIDRATRHLGTQHAWVQALLQAQPGAAQAARKALAGTQLADAAERARLLDANHFAASQDPLIRLARQLQPLHRQLKQQLEAEVTQPIRPASARVAQARFALYGERLAPDATGTLRLSFGRTAEVLSGGIRQPWFTTLGGLWARHDGFSGQMPFTLSAQLSSKRAALPASTALNFISSADIIGGNSGSPVVNAAGEWVGTAFDGNLDSLAGRFHYDETTNRMVTVHIDGIRVALRQIYTASHLADELGLPR
jgi:hypothetical protein